MEDTENIRNDLAKERNKLAEERTDLAKERTGLSYIRTGLSAIMAGIFFIGFFDPESIFQNIGYVTTIFGALFLFYGFHRANIS